MQNNVKRKPIKVSFITGAYKTENGSYNGLLFVYANKKSPRVFLSERIKYSTDGTYLEISKPMIIGRGYEKKLYEIAVEALREDWKKFFSSLKQGKEFHAKLGLELYDECKKEGSTVKLNGRTSYWFDLDLFTPEELLNKPKRRMFRDSGKGKCRLPIHFREDRFDGPADQ